MAPLNFKPLDIPSGSTFDFADSFEGTNIPKPPPSPPPAPKVLENGKPKQNGALSSHPTTPTNGDVEMKDAPATDASAMPPPAKKQQVSSASPASSNEKKGSSVRKLLSLRSLREKDRNSQAGSLASPTNGKLSTSEWSDARPGSPYEAASIMSDGSRQGLARKRSSGWFGSRRKSGFFGGIVADENTVPNGGAVQPIAKPRGPPPPTIPEFKEFGSINGALSDSGLGADDMFKDIKG